MGLLLVAGATGCAADSPVGSRTTAKLIECGFLTDGVPGRSSEVPLYVPDDCYDGCLAAATCEELSAALCNESITLPRRCDEACAYRCPEGALLRPDQECDGVEDCAGGADEAACDPPDEPPAPVRCPGAVDCNGIAECWDGSDEAGCPDFVCADGTRRSPWVRCDGRPECPDESDEDGCAMRTLTCR